VSAEDVGKLFEALQSPTFRRAFSESAQEAMANQQPPINMAAIPDALLDTLQGLSLQELGFIARVNRELWEGLSEAEREMMLNGPL
jgi:hypothetical protein